ncbi:MAG TPA: hypothetical protein DCQ29_05400 [Chitinophagaceae bacterium]|nr:hypothetical protein [Chitinophagaceae bacterium]
MKKISLLLLSILLYITHQAQFVATIPKVQESGYYRIKLSPAMIAATTAQATNIRIYNEQHVAQPFVMNVAALSSTSITAAVLLHQVVQNDTSICWIVDGVTNGLRDMVLYSNNTNTQPIVEVLGSNDQKSWYNIQERLNVPLVYTNRRYYATINLPPHNYRFIQFKQIASSSGKARLDVYRFTTIATNNSISSTLQPLSQMALRQIDSANGNTYLYATFTARNTIDALQLKVQEKLLFERTINLYQRGNIVQSWRFNQAQSNLLQPLSSITTDSILLAIENGDNPPLHWEAQAWQRQRFLLCYLTAGEQYSIEFGDATTPAPNYDLAALQQQVTVVIDTVNANNFKALVITATTSKNANRNYLIWIALIAVLTIVIIMVAQLVKKQNNK